MSPGSPAGDTAQEATLPLVEPISVVAKVAKLLITRSQNPPLASPIRWKDGYVHQKVRMSLHLNPQP